MKRIVVFAAVATALLAGGPVVGVGWESEPVDNTDYIAARQLVEADRYEEAIPVLQAALRNDPESADVYNLLGFSYRKTGKWADALAFYKRALALEPKHVGANEYLGELYLEQGRLALAEERLDVLLTACGHCEEYKELAEAIEGYGLTN